MNTSKQVLELSLTEIKAELKSRRGLCIWDGALSEMQHCLYECGVRVFSMDKPVRFREVLRVIDYYYKIDKSLKRDDIGRYDKSVFRLVSVKKDRLFLWERYITQLEVDYLTKRVRIYYESSTK